jgi:hypothetical protein
MVFENQLFSIHGKPGQAHGRVIILGNQILESAKSRAKMWQKRASTSLS